MPYPPPGRPLPAEQAAAAVLGTWLTVSLTPTLTPAAEQGVSKM